MGSLVEGMGNSHHIMRTVRPEAHWYFNQGIDPPDAPISSVRIKSYGAGRVVGLRYIPDSN